MVFSSFNILEYFVKFYGKYFFGVLVFIIIKDFCFLLFEYRD